VAGAAAAEEASEEAAEAASGETAEATPEQPAETSAAPNEADHEKAQQGNVNVVADSGLAVGAQDLYTTNPTDGQVGECKASEQDNNDFLRSESPNSSVESLQMMDHGLRNAQYQEQADKIEYILNPINEWFEDVKSRGNLLVSDPLEALDQGISNTYPFLDQITQQDVIQALEQAGVYEEGGILDRQAFDGLVSALPLPGGLGITRGIFNRAPNSNRSAGAMARREYQAAPYHGKVDNAVKSRAPTNGQDALDMSVQVKDTSPRRIGIDYKAGEFSVFDQTSNGIFHGHVRSWKDLTAQMQNALRRAGMVDKKGNILGGGQ
jgi:hypothetical protein